MTQQLEKPLIIGLSGASSSGKTTIAELLRNIFPDTVVLHEDDFYLPDDQIPVNETIQDHDWDCSGAIDFDSFTTVIYKLKHDIPFHMNNYVHVEEGNVSNKITVDVNLKNSVIALLQKKSKGLLSQRKIYLVDGFLMYHHKELLELMDIKLFFRADYLTLKSRRMSRKYTIDSGVWTDPPNYFELCVWPDFYNYHKSIFVNGTDEESVKKTGGQLNERAKNLLGIEEFVNSKGCDLTILLSQVVTVILKKVRHQYTK